MTDTETYRMPRREFLCGTAAVLGAAALGLEAAPTSAAPAEASLSVAYWTGTRLVDARTLPAGDTSLDRVRLTIHGHSGGDALRAISAYFPLSGEPDAAFTPFHAWAASKHVAPDSRFLMPVSPHDGLLLSAHGVTEAFCRLRTDTAAGQPKLHSGHYVLALGSPTGPGCRFDPDAMRLPAGPLTRRTLNGFAPVRFGYRVLTVEPA